MPMLQPDPALADEAARLADTFAARLAGATEDLAPPEALLAYAAAARRWAEKPYHRVDPTMVDVAARARLAGAEALLNRWLIAHLVAGFDLAANPVRIPESVASFYPDDLQRIMRDLSQAADTHYDLRRDAFVKEVAVLTFRLIPVGCWYVDPWASVPRSLPLRAGPGQFVRSLAVLSRAGGFRPYLFPHLHEPRVRERRPEMWRPPIFAKPISSPSTRGSRGSSLLAGSWTRRSRRSHRITPGTRAGRSRPAAPASLSPWSGVASQARSRRLRLGAGCSERASTSPPPTRSSWPRRALLAWARRVRSGAEPLYPGEPAVPLPAGPS